MKTPFLFVYGTLLGKENDYAVYLKNNSNVYLPGRIKGKLYDIGEYPGAVLTSAGDEYIYGTILQMQYPDSVLAVIDDYEGFGDDQPLPNEFIRVIADIETDTGQIICWMYIYNRSTVGLVKIEGGRYK